MSRNELRDDAPGCLLARLDERERNGLLACAERRCCEKGAFIFQAGAPSAHVYLLIEGRVKIFELSSLGREIILWFCFNGEIFGLAESPRGIPRTVYAQACSPASYYALPKAHFCEFLRSNPNAAMHVIDLLSGRMRGLGDMLLNFSSEDVASRLVKLLTRMGMVYGVQAGDEVRLNIPLTHQELADMIGASRQTVTTTLGMLRRSGLVRTENHCIVFSHRLGEGTGSPVVRGRCA